jgi:predicted ATPase
VDYLKKTHPKQWKLVLRSMRRVMPNLLDVETEYTTDRRIALQFAESGFGRPWSAEDISDGTIQTLALFCALFDPRSLLTLIEEPENSVHPWIIRVFAEACREVTGKAVVVTTHSPVLVNNLRPEEINIAWRSNGQTNVRALTFLDPEAYGLWDQGVNTLFELLDSGWLTEAVPADNE